MWTREPGPITSAKVAARKIASRGSLRASRSQPANAATQKSAMAWERQALLRARPVIGSAALGARFDEARRSLLARPPKPDLAEEIHR